ncbi:hypothetical protein FGO68_gene325 [Halteria grandinella]|uniref:Uncharacterized protein n=1 Tax=Halteria grandinella TaxID=5974 RepID=A0A8J8P308_HALGN|nr:hypothetical protein FGO68_gene325 [Halteria grandinella]
MRKGKQGITISKDSLSKRLFYLYEGGIQLVYCLSAQFDSIHIQLSQQIQYQTKTSPISRSSQENSSQLYNRQQQSIGMNDQYFPNQATIMHGKENQTQNAEIGATSIKRTSGVSALLKMVKKRFDDQTQAKCEQYNFNFEKQQPNLLNNLDNPLNRQAVEEPKQNQIRISGNQTQVAEEENLENQKVLPDTFRNFPTDCGKIQDLPQECENFSANIEKCLRPVGNQLESPSRSRETSTATCERQETFPRLSFDCYFAEDVQIEKNFVPAAVLISQNQEKDLLQRTELGAEYFQSGSPHPHCLSGLYDWPTKIKLEGQTELIKTYKWFPETRMAPNLREEITLTQQFSSDFDPELHSSNLERVSPQKEQTTPRRSSLLIRLFKRNKVQENDQDICLEKISLECDSQNHSHKQRRPQTKLRKGSIQQTLSKFLSPEKTLRKEASRKMSVLNTPDKERQPILALQHGEEDPQSLINSSICSRQYLNQINQKFNSALPYQSTKLSHSNTALSQSVTQRVIYPRAAQFGHSDILFEDQSLQLKSQPFSQSISDYLDQKVIGSVKEMQKIGGLKQLMFQKQAVTPLFLSLAQEVLSTEPLGQKLTDSPFEVPYHQGISCFPRLLIEEQNNIEGGVSCNTPEFGPRDLQLGSKRKAKGPMKNRTHFLNEHKPKIIEQYSNELQLRQDTNISNRKQNKCSKFINAHKLRCLGNCSKTSQLAGAKRALPFQMMTNCINKKLGRGVSHGQSQLRYEPTQEVQMRDDLLSCEHYTLFNHHQEANNVPMTIAPLGNDNLPMSPQYQISQPQPDSKFKKIPVAHDAALSVILNPEDYANNCQ